MDFAILVWKYLFIIYVTYTYLIITYQSQQTIYFIISIYKLCKHGNFISVHIQLFLTRIALWGISTKNRIIHKLVLVIWIAKIGVFYKSSINTRSSLKINIFNNLKKKCFIHSFLCIDFQENNKSYH